MTRSMTAFARAEVGAAVWEIRSVNHRYLDITFKMPESFRSLETQLKGCFSDRVQRGKLDCSLKLNMQATKPNIHVDRDLVRALGKALDEVQNTAGLVDRGDALALLKWPDVIVPEDRSIELAGDIQAAFTNAVDELVTMREREGEKLAALISSRLDDIDATVTAVRAETPTIIQGQHDKLMEKINSLDVSVDPARLEQELVILAQKLDVDEELDRLVTHVTEVRRNLGQSEPVGRRLDFLMQELNREANTLSSKAAVSTTTLHAVDLKVLIEQMREQIQNIE